MNENIEQPERDTTEVNPSRPLSAQEPALSDDSPYEEMHLSYIPQPIASSPQTNPLPRFARARKAAPRSSSRSAPDAGTKGGMSGGGALVGVILGAILGIVVGATTGGNLLLWGGIGALVIGVALTLLPTFFSDGTWMSFVDQGLLSEVFNCCSFSVILLVASVITIGGLLWYR